MIARFKDIAQNKPKRKIMKEFIYVLILMSETCFINKY